MAASKKNLGKLAAMVDKVDDDELLVVVVGKRHLVAQSVKAPGMQLADLRRSATLATKAFAPKVELGAAEAAVLKEGGFKKPGAQRGSDKGALEYLQMLSTSLTPEQAAKLLRVNASRIRQRLGARQLLGIKDGRSWKLPRFQFLERRLVPGLERVLPKLPKTLHPVAVHRWLTSAHPDLEVGTKDTISPIEWLSRGLDPARVAELASRL